MLKPKYIWEAFKKKFQSSVKIHELALKSRLSRSDFIIAACFSIDVSQDGDARCDMGTLNFTTDDALTRIGS